MALIVALLNSVVFVLTSLMLCYYNDKDLIFFFKRPEQLFGISNNAASRLECCTNVKAKPNCTALVVYGHSQPEFTTAEIAVKNKINNKINNQMEGNSRIIC
jgi:hypothetical protein